MKQTSPMASVKEFLLVQTLALSLCVFHVVASRGGPRWVLNPKLQGYRACAQTI